MFMCVSCRDGFTGTVVKILAVPDGFCVLYLVVSQKQVVQVLRMSLFTNVGLKQDKISTPTLFSEQDARLTATQLKTQKKHIWY